jgi:DNA-binding response OmpR family regulator
MNNIKVLFAEDEKTLGMIVRDSLQSRGYDVEWCEDGNSAWKAWNNRDFDICILDVMMPGMDGFELAKRIRVKDTSVPVIFLTAKSQVQDVLEGFNSGADDYMRKPFSVEELMARMKAVLGRRPNDEVFEVPEQIKVGLYTLDSRSQILSGPGKPRKLTYKESALLQSLWKYRDSVMERKDVLIDLWGDDTVFNARSMDVFITKLRKYMSGDDSIEIINVRGVGYKLIC